MIQFTHAYVFHQNLIMEQREASKAINIFHIRFLNYLVKLGVIYSNNQFIRCGRKNSYLNFNLNKEL